MTEQIRSVVQVVANPGGWWDVKYKGGSILGQFMTEFQARESGRINAARFRADLEIDQAPGPTLYWHFDESSGTLTARPASQSGSGER